MACCYENYLAYFLCGFLGGNEKNAEIRAGSLGVTKTQTSKTQTPKTNL